MSKDSVKFTLLIATLNRPTLLRTCLKSIASQTYANYEVIVVDQSDSVDVELSEMQGLAYLHIDKRGLSNARNRGLGMATGDYVALVDDDATYSETFLEEAERYISDCVRPPAIVSGRGKDPKTGHYLLPTMSLDRVKKISFISAFEYCMSSTMVIRRDLLDVGFDLDFGIGGTYYAAEDSDIVFRALVSNLDVVYNPAMLIYHPSGSNDDIDLQKVYRYSIGIGAVLKKHYLSNGRFRFAMLYAYALARSIAGVILYSLGKKNQERSIYALRGKREGFKDYDKKV